MICVVPNPVSPVAWAELAKTPGMLFPEEFCITVVRFVVPLVKYLAPHRRLAIILLFGLAIEVVFETGLRYSFRYVVDEAIRPQRVGVLVSVFVLLGGAAVVYTVACVLCDYFWAQVLDPRHE